MYFVINTQTIGYPLLDLPLSHTFQTVIRQLSAIVFDQNGEEVDMVSAPKPLIDLDGSVSTTSKNEVTLVQAKGGYVHALTLYSWFVGWGERCEVIVGHNVHFDLHAMRALGAKCADVDWTPKAAIYCTMINAAPVLKLPRAPDPIGGRKWQFKPPTIAECMHHFWHEDIPEGADTLNLARASNRIFQKLCSNS